MKKIVVPIAAMMISAATVFVIVEGYYRLTYSPDADNVKGKIEGLRYIAETDRPFFEHKSVNGTAYLYKPANSVGNWAHPVHSEWMIPLKKTSKKRIIVLGESSSSLIGIDLQNVVRNSPFRDRLEVIDCGIGASSLDIVDRVFSEIVHYEPDVIVLFFGHNVMFDYSEYKMKYRFYDFIGKLSAKSYWAARIMEGMQNVNLTPHIKDGYAVHLARYKEFLEKLSRLTKEKNISVFICTAPANLLKSQIVESGNDEEGYYDALFDYSSGQRRRAIAKLTRIVQRDSVPFLYYVLGGWCYEEADYANAKKYYQKAIDETKRVGTAKSSTNGLIRDMAMEKGFTLIDLERMLEKEAPHGIIGYELMSDNCHAVREVVLCEAEEIYRECVKHFWLEDVSGQLAPLRFSSNYADNYLRKIQRKPVFAECGAMGYSRLLKNAVPRKQFEKIEGKIVRQNEGSAFGGPGAFALVELALAYRAAHFEDESFKYLNLAEVLAPGWSEPYFQKGIHHIQRHEWAKARREFQNAFERGPTQKKILYFLARLEKSDGVTAP